MASLADVPAAAAIIKPGLIKRQPVVIGGAVLGLLEAFILYAPSLGIKLPTITQSVFAALVAVAGAFGVSKGTRPLALSVPAPPEVARELAAVKSVSVLTAVAGAVAAVAKPNPIKAAAAKAKAKLKGKP